MTELATPQPARHPHPIVKAKRLAYLIFERPDLDRAEEFLNAFGLVTAEKTAQALYLRTASEEPFCYVVERAPAARFVGLAFEVSDADDLHKLSHGREVSSLQSDVRPCGGELVRLRDPSGFQVEAVWGQKAYAALPARDALELNTAGTLKRVNETQRPAMEAPAIHKLGHVVLEVADYQDTSAWYTEHFGLVPSDVQVLPDGSPAVAFFRLDLGDVPADHHTLALAQGFAPRFNHSAYEVSDLDAIGVGQRILREGGYRHAWGIGRHILGSQIFDYWNDPWGDKHEHYSDGDVFTADEPTGISVAARGGLSQWGPPVPPDFLRPKPSLRNLRDLIHNVSRSPDLSVRKLISMAQRIG